MRRNHKREKHVGFVATNFYSAYIFFVSLTALIHTQSEVIWFSSFCATPHVPPTWGSCLGLWGVMWLHVVAPPQSEQRRCSVPPPARRLHQPLPGCWICTRWYAAPAATPALCCCCWDVLLHSSGMLSWSLWCRSSGLLWQHGTVPHHHTWRPCFFVSFSRVLRVQRCPSLFFQISPGADERCPQARWLKSPAMMCTASGYVLCGLVIE